MKRSWPYFAELTPGNMLEAVRGILGTREEDIKDYRNLPQQLVSGRNVTPRTPTGSADVITGDRVGDISITPSYIYTLVDNAGTPVWRRVSLSAW